MAIVAARRSRPNPAFDWCAEIPSGFHRDNVSEAPITGVHTLPITIWWSSEHRTFDLGNDDTLSFVYERVLHEGTAADVVAWIQPRELIRLWDQMRVTAAVADTWDPWVRAQCP